MSDIKILGTYRAVSCHDASSMEREGQPYVAINHLTARTGRAECEIQFEDGQWLLADPTQDLGPHLRLA